MDDRYYSSNFLAICYWRFSSSFLRFSSSFLMIDRDSHLEYEDFKIEKSALEYSPAIK
jgi:hypothetical protein